MILCHCKYVCICSGRECMRENCHCVDATKSHVSLGSRLGLPPNHCGFQVVLLYAKSRLFKESLTPSNVIYVALKSPCVCCQYIKRKYLKEYIRTKEKKSAGTSGKCVRWQQNSTRGNMYYIPGGLFICLRNSSFIWEWGSALILSINRVIFSATNDCSSRKFIVTIKWVELSLSHSLSLFC